MRNNDRLRESVARQLTCRGFSLAVPGKWVAGLLAIWAFPSAAVRVGPPADYDAPAFRVYEGSTTLLEITFQFHPAEGTAQPPEFIRGARAPEGSFLASDWRIAAPDRNDRFSVRWFGYWTPEETKFGIRLSAKGKAILYLNGKEELTTENGSIESILFLDARPHELRVDSSHPSGAASAQLEWRIGDEAWKPLVARTDRKKESALGWNADYYFGSNFEQKVFSRTDEAIAFDWGEGSPFDRAEDTPTLTWRIVNGPDGRACGEISANREGTLALGLILAASDESKDASLSFTNPLLQFTGGKSGEAVSLQFDREASKATLGQGEPMEAGTHVGDLEFSLNAGDSIRFWETGGDLQTGAQVAGALKEAETRYQGSRPRLRGEWASLDEITIGNGAWFLQVLCDGETRPEVRTEEAVRLARVVAPDLVSKLEASSAGAEAASPVAKGLKAAAQGLTAVESKLRENPQGGFDLMFGQTQNEEFLADHWPIDEKRFDILSGANEFRVADPTGTFFAFDSPVTIRWFQVDGAGNWTGEVELDSPAVLRAGPAERVSGILWNEVPLTLVREGDRVQARLTGTRGRFQMRFRAN